MGRMPEANKCTLKAPLEDELAHLAKAAPHISVIAIADGAKGNWTFLETVSDRCLVDYLLTASCQGQGRDRRQGQGVVRPSQGDPAQRFRRCRQGETLPAPLSQGGTKFRAGRDLARGADVLRKQPPPHELPVVAHAGSSDRFGRRGGGEQDPGDKTSQALGPALGSRGRPGGADLAITLSIGSIRCRLETCHGEIEIHCRSGVSKRQR